MKGPSLLGGKFWVGDRVFQVLGLQPHLVSLFKGFEILTVFEGHYLAGKFMGGKSFISGGIKGF